MNTSALGASREYRALEDGHRGDQRIGVPVDVTGYQDLHQTKPREKYKSLLVVGNFSEVKKDSFAEFPVFLFKFHGTSLITFDFSLERFSILSIESNQAITLALVLVLRRFEIG